MHHWTVVYVHGTGVRDPVFTKTFSVVQQALQDRLTASAVHVEPCYWGGPHGARLRLDGATIPSFDTTRAAPSGLSDELPDEEYEIALWAVLYADPFAELELLALRGTGEAEDIPGQEPPGAALDAAVTSLQPNGAPLEGEAQRELSGFLTANDLDRYFAGARDALLSAPAFRDLVRNAVEPLTDYRVSIARALLSRALQVRNEDLHIPAGETPLNPEERDRAVDFLVAALGGTERGVASWVKARAGRMVAGIATGWLERRRGRVSGEITPALADIVAYQARPEAIRSYIRETVLKASDASCARGEDGAVTLIAHSLGGIAAVDTLIEKPLLPVRQLITVGSQAGLLYELGALTSMPFNEEVKAPPHPLPDHFPAWLNIYDPRDFLSYLVAPLFGSRATDQSVDNRQPFPESHSAYWKNPVVWETIIQSMRAPHDG